MDEPENESVEEKITLLKKEVSDLRKILHKRFKLKFETEKKLLVPDPISFVEFEKRFGTPIPTTSLESVLSDHNSFMRECTLLSGLCFAGANDDGSLLFELSFMAGSEYLKGYRVCIKHVEDGQFEPINYVLPHGLDMKSVLKTMNSRQRAAKANCSLLEKTMISYSLADLPLFLSFLHSCGHALLQRKIQIQEFLDYCNERELAVDLFSSYTKRYIEISVQSDDIIATQDKEMIKFILKYRINSIIPFDVKYQKEHISDAEKTSLTVCLEEFVSRPLESAIKNIMDIKRIKSQLPDESSDNSIEMDPNEKEKQAQKNNSEPSREISHNEKETEKIHKEGNTVIEQQRSKNNSKLKLSQNNSIKEMLQNSKVNCTTTEQKSVPSDEHSNYSGQDDPSPEKKDIQNVPLDVIVEGGGSSDLMSNDLSSISISCGVTLRKLPHRRHSMVNMVSSTPVRTVHQMVLSEKGLKGKEFPKHFNLRRKYTRTETDSTGQRNIQEFMGKDVGDPQRRLKSPLISPAERLSISKEYLSSKEISSSVGNKKLTSCLDELKDLKQTSPLKRTKLIRSAAIHKDTPTVQSSRVKKGLKRQAVRGKRKR